MLPRYVDFYREAYAPFMRERWLAGTPGATLLHLSQPAGDFSDRPVSDIVVVRDLKGIGRATIDHGAGRFVRRSRPDDLYAVPPGVATTVLLDTPQELLAVALSPGLFDEWVTDVPLPPGGLDVGRLAAGAFRNPLIPTLLDRLWRAADGSAGHDRLYGEAGLVLLVCEVLAEAGRPARVRRGGLAAWQLRRVMAYMHAHLDRDVSLAELAALVGLSPHHLCRAFADSTGRPPHRWLVERRVERAQEMMVANARLGLTEVALAVGYGSQSALGTAFRRVTGRTPSAWRRDRAG
jgi:AraC family transcriptional regulator